MKRLLHIIKRILHLMLAYIVSVLMGLTTKVNDHQVLFLSDVRETLGGNLKSVYDYLENTDYIRIIEFKNDRRDTRSIKGFFNHIRLLVTSKYILLDDFNNSIAETHFKHNQKIIQLWHGPGAYKKFGYSRVKTGEYKNYQIDSGYKKTTYAAVSAKTIKWCYAEAFGIDESKVIDTGMCRTDDFFNPSYLTGIKKSFYRQYPELKNKKIILFAPTYRGNKVEKASYDFSKISLDVLKERYSKDYVLIIKWHPALYNNIQKGLIKDLDYSKYKGFVYDFSTYRDINDLLIVSDILITDYSSVIFDYALLNKPIIYYTYDLEEYSGKSGRGLYFDFNDYVYGSVVNNFEALLTALDHPIKDEEKRKAFINRFMSSCDGHATQKTCDYIFNH